FVINAGSLIAGSGTSTIIPNASTVTILPGATVDFATNDTSETIGALTIVSGGSSGGTLSIGSTGTITLGGNVTSAVNGSGAVGGTISSAGGNLALAATRTFTVNKGNATNDLTVSAPISTAFG